MLTDCVLSGELLTWAADIVEWWKRHFEELPNRTNTSSVEEAESEDTGEDPLIFMAEVVRGCQDGLQ